jgi:penicillin-binding protein 1A
MRAVVWTLLWLPMPAAWVVVNAWGQQVESIPAVDTIAVRDGYEPTRVLSARGFLIGGLDRGGRAWVDWHDLSPAFVAAVIASEDARFFTHTGYDLRGILRAFAANRSAGENVQGGSTLTQQLAKSFVGNERTWDRKLAELVVARRIEARWSKARIFEAWANRAYFGAGATGVAAAADIYFGVTPMDLDLAQAALLAALVPAPGAVNPFRYPERARVRRDRVLERMRVMGLAADDEIEAALASPVVLVERDARRVRAPSLEAAIWRELAALRPDRDWLRSGDTVYTALDLVRQRRGEAALRDGLHGLDARQGLRGVLGHVASDAREQVRAGLATLDCAARACPVLIEAVESDRVRVFDGRHERDLDAAAWDWAVPWRVDAVNHDESIEDATEAFVVGDLVILRDGRITQFPRVEGAFGSVDLADGAMEAAVGGYDADRSVYHRMVQSCRQPGSTFKPIVYSVALDRGYTVASQLRDAPIRIELGPFEEWRPRNADGDFEGHITMWEAFIWSRNLPAIAVIRDVTARQVIARAQSLGVGSEMVPVESLALGASCLAPTELSAVFAAFARGGVPTTAHLVVDAVTADGGSPLRWRRADSAARMHLLPSERMDRLWSLRSETPRPALRASTAWTVSWLLSEVVRRGTGAELADLGWPVAGKTGTTNAYDAWFAGFTARESAVVWIGSDRNTRPLGRRETGGHLALPVFGAALLPVDPSTPLLAAPPDDLEFAGIEPESGLRAPPDRWSIPMPFERGRAPLLSAPTMDVVRTIRADRVQREF